MDVLAHGGQLTGDEIAFISGGLSFALLFPILVLMLVARRTRDADAVDLDGPVEQTLGPEDSKAGIVRATENDSLCGGTPHSKEETR